MRLLTRCPCGGALAYVEPGAWRCKRCGARRLPPKGVPLVAVLVGVFLLAYTAWLLLEALE